MKKLPNYIIPIKKLVHAPKIKTWCKLPYPNHPKGCPKNVEECSNGNQYITDILKMNKPMYFVYSEFNLRRHMLKMKRKYPHWTKRQCKNVRYWQGTSRKQLKERTIKALEITNCQWVTYCPEAYGVNVFETAELSKFILDPTRKIKFCHHISLIGFSS